MNRLPRVATITRRLIMPMLRRIARIEHARGFVVTIDDNGDATLYGYQDPETAKMFFYTQHEII